MSVRIATSASVPTLLIAAVLLTAASIPASARPMPDGIADKVETLLPTVVNISTAHPVNIDDLDADELPPELKRMLKDRHGKGGPILSSLGSGVIVDPSGLIATNDHVISGADRIAVVLQDGRKLEGKLVGRDPVSDLALIRVASKEPLPAARWGKSDKVRVGDWVFAIGNAFGLGSSVTSGIVSARAREIEGSSFEDMLQTDAALNRGNSGGPLFDMNGEIVGINSAIYSPNGENVGIGFAIPADKARAVIATLEAKGRIARGFLGVQAQTVTAEVRRSLGLPDQAGVLVAYVAAGGPAAKVNLKAGDVVTAIGGRPTPDLRAMRKVVADLEPGRPVEVSYLRGGKRLRGQVRPTEQEDEATEPVVASGSAMGDEIPVDLAEVMGLTLAGAVGDLRKQFGLSEEGILVLDVDPDSRGSAIGLLPGDLLVEVDRHKMTKPNDLPSRMRQAAKAGRGEIPALVERSGQRRFIALPTS